MPMTVIVTRNPAPRMRGFLASVALEIAPGVYTAPRMTKAVRERVWEVLTGWRAQLAETEDENAVVMTWRDASAPGGQRVLTLGAAAKTLVDADGVLLVKREISGSIQPDAL